MTEDNPDDDPRLKDTFAYKMAELHVQLQALIDETLEPTYNPLRWLGHAILRRDARRMLAKLDETERFIDKARDDALRREGWIP